MLMHVRTQPPHPPAQGSPILPRQKGGSSLFSQLVSTPHLRSHDMTACAPQIRHTSSGAMPQSRTGRDAKDNEVDPALHARYHGLTHLEALALVRAQADDSELGIKTMPTFELLTKKLAAKHEPVGCA
jgi:hypothetical protein